MIKNNMYLINATLQVLIVGILAALFKASITTTLLIVIILNQWDFKKDHERYN